jgi:hypothetical protein
MIVFERRACSILYSLLRTRSDPRTFLVPANVCPIVPITLLEAGQAFELVDIAEPALTIDPRMVADRLRSRPTRYGGLLFVRTYGSERDPGPFFAELKSIQPDLLIIDDKCLCRPDCSGATVSPHADVTLFSTGRAKHADLGGGGFAHLGEAISYKSERAFFSEVALSRVTRSYESALALGAPFRRTSEGWLDLREPEVGWDEYAISTREAVQTADRHKTALSSVYERELPDSIQFPREFQSWRFNIRLPSPERFLASAFAAGLFASRHYASLGPLLGSEAFPVAEGLRSTVVNLFNDRNFDEARALRMVDLVRRHLDQRFE